MRAEVAFVKSHRFREGTYPESVSKPTDLERTFPS